MREKLFVTLAMTATFPVFLASAQPAFAATQSYFDTNITVQGQSVSKPQHIVGMDNGNQTAFLPVYYLQTALRTLGVQSTWNGSVLNLEVPKETQIDLSNLPASQSLNKNNMAMSINGSIVEYGPRRVVNDPAGGTLTTYVPVYYIEQTLNRLGITSSWDGTNWGMTSSIPLATKLEAIKDFAQALQIVPDASGTSPYDDVSGSDWGYINAVVKKGYFMPDSSSHFGSGDSISAQDVDHAYQLYVGIPDSHMSWNAGGNTLAWGNAINLNEGVGTVGGLNVPSEQQIMQNLSDLRQGWSKDSSGVYHLWFQPYDGFTDFEPATPGLPQSEVQQDMASSIQRIDDVTFTVNGNTATFRMDGLSDQSPNELTCSTYYAPNYSLDNGKTWAKAPGIYGYDSRDNQNGGQSIAPSSVLVKGTQFVDIDAYVITHQSDWVFGGVEVAFNNSTITSVKCARAE